MVTYKIEVQDKTGKKIGKFDTFRNLSINRRLNNYGSCSFDVPGNDDKIVDLVSLRVNTIWIYRIEDGAEDLIFAGEMALRQGKLDEKGNNWISLYAYDWLEQLNLRYTVAERVFSWIDQGNIAMTLIDETQADTDGDLGITEGTIEVTLPRDIVFTNENILEAIKKMADKENGFDFELTTDKVFNVYAIKGVDRSGEVVLKYGLNITSCQITEDFLKPASRAIITGEEYGGTDMSRVEDEDAIALASIGLREFIYSEMDVVSDNSLTDRAAAILTKYSTPVLKVDCTLKKSSVNVADFDLGDVIKVIIKNGIYDIDENYRVYEWTVKYDTVNVETVSLVLSTLNADI